MIYATSDLHGNLPEVPQDAHLLLIAGDICPDFRNLDAYSSDFLDRTGLAQSAWLSTEFCKWLEALVARNVEVVATWGNHDFVGERPHLVPELPWNLLVDECAIVGGLKVYGTPWVPNLPGWAFYGDERRLKMRAQAIENCDVLMTHGPPLGAGDWLGPPSPGARAFYGSNNHVGDASLNPHIHKAFMVVCGHIHEDRGWHHLDGVDVVNVAAVDENYVLRDYPFTLLYPPMA